MNPASLFIRRPVATSLLTLGILLAGLLAFRLLPVSPLPQVDFPTIAVTAKLPGASPEVMAATVATPLERTLGRIAGVNEITSMSAQGTTRVIMQFDLNRDINGAANDVQAGINAARALLPSGMPSNPSYRKVNPADAPIMILALTSDTLTRGQMYDAADTILGQKLLQVDGVGDVNVGGGSQPAVRVELNPNQLSRYGLSLETVRSAITATNANRPKGVVEDGQRQWQIQANDQANQAQDYQPLILGYHNGAAVRIKDVGQVSDSVVDRFNTGLVGKSPAVLIMVFRQPGANIIDTVDRVQSLLPSLQASIPAAMRLQVVMERSKTIRASLHEVERNLLLSVGLVIMVVFLFLRNGRAVAIPAITVPVSLVGTFAIMYLAGYSLNNLSLMALTIATGFVVDDTVVVLENISRHIENGLKPRQAALQGAREVGFTVLSMTLSLIAVFIPILLMGGITGRLFHEFAVTLSAAILVSLLVSLSTTPMLCARWLHPVHAAPGRLSRGLEAGFDGLLRGYQRSLAWGLRHAPLMLLLLLLTIAGNVWLYGNVAKGFFPEQDTGSLNGALRADQSISFAAMEGALHDMMGRLGKDPVVDKVVGFIGGGGGGGGNQSNSASLFISLKPLAERHESAAEIIARLRKQLSIDPRAQLFLQPVQDLRIGGRSSRAMYQYTLQGDDLNELRDWTPRIMHALEKLPMLADVNTDQDVHGLQTTLQFDRDRMKRFGLTQQQVDAALYDAFGQRQVSTLYNALNQYHVVMEVDPRYSQDPSALQRVYLQAADGSPIPLSAIASWAPGPASLSVNHQSGFAASTVSFNLVPGTGFSEATTAINQAVSELGIPESIRASFQGGAKVYQDSMSSQPLLILTALLAVYLVLGMLYESLIHPLTILSTLPSAGVGALLALQMTGGELNIISMIGILLLVGIVKKNAIMMVDVAITLRRDRDYPASRAIYQACLLRFRPIMMTTVAALLAAIPLALGHGDGAELRTPLGISIVGGLLLSQLLTLYTTPVVYLYLDRLQRPRPTR